MENLLYSYWPIIERPRLEWPDGKRIAFYLGLNIEHYEIDKPSTSIFANTASLAPDPLNYGWRDYGPRVGLWRMMEVMDKHGVRGSVLLNSDVCTRYPQIISEGNKRGWVWLAHGKNNAIFEAGMSLEEERTYLTDVVGTIRQHTGQQPKGWLGPALTETFNTPDILAELGLTYILDWCNDDQPYPVNVKSGRMISVPYSIEVNDIPLFVGKSLSGEDFYRTLVDQFEGLYEAAGTSGLVMALAVHPFVIGLPFRLKYLSRFLAHITAEKGVWVTTSDEISAWYMERYYQQARKAQPAMVGATPGS
jgi:peptidoglycan/xylan/chitin deacetylase (PgdA/CDA1 family)